MPKPAPEKADEIAELDPGLLPDEQAYVSHYLAYADVLLHEEEADGSDLGYRPQVTGHRVTGRAQPESRNSKVLELPKMRDSEDNGDHNKNAA